MKRLWAGQVRSGRVPGEVAAQSSTRCDLKKKTSGLSRFMRGKIGVTLEEVGKRHDGSQ